MDDDRSGSLSVSAFEKACKDYKIAIAPEFMPTLFDAFDTNGDKSLSIEEFINAICGNLSPSRT
jgi:Ca2+-binding EF-hand superfamily protein